MRSELSPLANSFHRALVVAGGPHSALLHRCESVIEQAFAAAFVVSPGFTIEVRGAHWDIKRGEELVTLAAQHEVTLARDPWAGGVDPEHVFARADFAMLSGETVVLLVDIDGHDFHERSRKQIAHDRSRDRQLLRCGLPVARFTGSEINRNARSMAAEAFWLAVQLGGKK